jgi:hypothetical protein
MDVIDHPERLRRFSVRALDGRIGIVIDADQDALVVKRRVLARRITIPARAVSRIDTEGRSIALDRTRRQVSMIPQPGRTGRRAWFIPASNHVPGATNPIVGAGPSRDDDEEHI